jgi:hypothetical protein
MLMDAGQLIGVAGWFLIVACFAVPGWLVLRAMNRKRAADAKAAEALEAHRKAIAAGAYGHPRAGWPFPPAPPRARYTPAASATVIAAQQSSGGDMMTGMLIGGLAGYAMGHSGHAEAAAPAFTPGGGEF